MARVIKIIFQLRRGLHDKWIEENPILSEGEPAFETDTFRLKIGDGAGGVSGVKGSAEESYRTGQVSISKANIGLGNVDNTSDANKPISTAQRAALNEKVDKVTGKGLSTNDLTTTLKSNYDTAYTHSQTAHAPSNAERNVIVGIQRNGTDISVNTSTRKVNITVPTKTSELTNDSSFITGPFLTEDEVNTICEITTANASDFTY